LGELYLIQFRGDYQKFPIVEKDGYDLAIEYRLRCDPLEREGKKPVNVKKQILLTWGVDKTSGMEGFTSQLKEWTVMALLEASESTEGKERENGKFDFAGDVDRGRTREDDEIDTDRAEIFESRKRNALRPAIQNPASLS
jgi:hypothetical protein